MRFNFFIGTRAIFGDNCVIENEMLFSQYGKKAFIVTGKSSAIESGALEDVCNVLTRRQIGYCIFNEIENNPTMENVSEAANEARKYGADFIIGIGGGSPLDAAKAIAVLAVNDISPVELYKNSFLNIPLPIIAIPTTAGTGSEVTPYSILTRKDIQIKMSFGNVDIFPKIAFLDARYTDSLPYETTVNTAVDALTHSIEGYICKRSTTASDLLAEKSIEQIGLCIDSLIKKDIKHEIREKLLYASMLGGMVISHTGTTILHGMGYSLTYFLDIAHGKANGLLLEKYLVFNYEEAKFKIDTILKLLNFSSLKELGNVMEALLGEMPKLMIEDIEMYAEKTINQRSALNNIREVSINDIVKIYRDAAKI